MGSAFEEVGAVRFESVLSDRDTARVFALFDGWARPGLRLDRERLRPVADMLWPGGPIGSVAARLLGSAATPVRALLLDKSPAVNWRLGWHQDRTIAVRERLDVPGFGPWSVKAGQPHVQPPDYITARMVTLRVHLDDVDQDNAPLQVIPGSHRLGRLSNGAIEELAARSDKLICVAATGDVWAYATAIVHASSEQARPDRRRVLQIDYSADELPNGLEWMQLV